MHTTITYDEVAGMNNDRSFDTLQCANKLKAAGVPEKQAEVIAETMAETIDDKLATKHDLEQAKLELKRDIKELELRMTVRLGSIVVGSLSVLIVLMKLFKL